ncbi:WecB/TagA/CpsF family glycosyltransferase [Thiocapsa imhoffii]|nr:WecB/TagA/CpsF family glycosyltransferase [Thiocapsa imhoffii]
MTTIKMKHPEVFDAIGTSVAATTFQEFSQDIQRQLKSGRGGYVTFANSHTTVMARRDPVYANALTKAYRILPDGRSVYLVGRLRYRKRLEQLAGPDVMGKLLTQPFEPALRHFFYGSTQETLSLLIARIKQSHPNAIIVGQESPPFRPLSSEEQEAALRRIQGAQADIIWIGLGAPKQELWMSEHANQLKPAILFGVGAAFDFHAGTSTRAPDWMRRAGLEWLHRLTQEPKRLWRRYALSNSFFLFYVFKDLITQRAQKSQT